MKHIHCEREPEVVIATRSNRPDTLHTAALGQHIQDCAICAETRRVTLLLTRYAASVESAVQPLTAACIWRTVQERRRQNNLKRATRSIALMRIFGIAYVFLLAAWGLRALWRIKSEELISALDTLTVAPVLIGVSFAFLCIAAGASFLLIVGRRLTVASA